MFFDQFGKYLLKFINEDTGETSIYRLCSSGSIVNLNRY